MRRRRRNQPEVRESQRVDVTEFSINDTETWQTNDVIDALRDALGSLEGSADAISGWSSFLDKDKRRRRTD